MRDGACALKRNEECPKTRVFNTLRNHGAALRATFLGGSQPLLSNSTLLEIGFKASRIRWIGIEALGRHFVGSKGVKVALKDSYYGG